MRSFTKRDQIVILVIVFIIIFSLGYKYFIKDIIISRGKSIEVIEYNEIIDEPQIVDVDNQIIMVHISGQVYKPGIIELELGKRVVDAVELAGGLKSGADLDRINLAKKLVDEEKIYVPAIGEDNSLDILAISSKGIETERIDINTCSKEELVSLPGIGDVTANKIIDYRTTNKFKTIEDIKNVSGIGDKKFEAIKELIIVK